MIEPIPFVGIIRVPTQRQIEVAQFIIHFHKEFGRGPTTREVAKKLECSQNNAWRLMKTIAKKGDLCHQKKECSEDLSS